MNHPPHHRQLGRPCVVLPVQALEHWARCDLVAVCDCFSSWRPCCVRSSLDDHASANRLPHHASACLTTCCWGRGHAQFGHAVVHRAGLLHRHPRHEHGRKGSAGIPLVLIPLVGGLAGAFFAILLGLVTTKKSGTTFAMITLGVGELVAAMALMFPSSSGAGRHHHRPCVRHALLRHHLRPGHPGVLPDRCVLLCVHCGHVCVHGHLLGRILNAVRDNPERNVEFIGYNTQRVRYFAFIIAGFLQALAAAATINFEIITGADSLSVLRSGATCCSPSWAGPRSSLGPSLVRCCWCWLRCCVRAVQGLALVPGAGVPVHGDVRALGGIASLIMMNLRLVRQTAPLWVSVPGPLAWHGPGGRAWVQPAWWEMTYHLQLNAAVGQR